MTIQLSIENMTKLYPTGEGIRDISLQVKQGEMVTLLGPSGCGKTTVLRSVGGFIEPGSGDIRITDDSVLRLPPEKRPTAMVFQSYNLWPHMTVYDNLAFSLKLRKKSKAEIKQKVQWALGLVQLTGAEKKYPSELSGGQQQRIALARALLLEPKVLLLDEPFSALDAKLRHQLREELRDIQARQNLTMLFVTHDQEEALSISDRIVVMNKGRIEQIATPEEIYNNPASLFVAQFIGRMNFLPGEIRHHKLHIGDLQQDYNGAESGGVTVCVRPEDVVLAGEGEPFLEARIEKVMMLGHYAEVTVQTAIGPIKMFIDRARMPQYATGESIRITCLHTHVFPNKTEEE
ncbi:ABC transporter ATP-binding protein [Ectobacillus sp. SYSU M60031]|uniref:Carnitine transport ATP-binding protein OpuCA n=1 Tax=Ectobacillus ponti TaxID=2961894 RepID=A0AA42BS53_9BACI|nr:ABC transporter ATP-binding protein [Ectobacillus ponti]MCP8971021.1 ABC transporter ATP-binding protein [Ectobacillus ponti]